MKSSVTRAALSRCFRAGIKIVCSRYINLRVIFFIFRLSSDVLHVSLFFSPASVSLVDLWQDPMVQYEALNKDYNQCFTTRHPSPLMVCLLFKYCSREV